MPSAPQPYQRACFQASKAFSLKALQWASEFEYLSYFNNNNIPYPEGAFPHMLAAGADTLWQLGDAPFESLAALHAQSPDWLMGYFSYDLKNKIHGLSSALPDSIDMPPCLFYRPGHLLFFSDTEVEVLSTSDPELVYRQIVSTPPALPAKPASPINLKTHMSKEAYLQKVAAIQQHILEGDCYELNLCQEFSAENVAINPLSLFLELSLQSPTPFASFQRFGEHYLLCASPERFLQKSRDQLISQPMKGTISRGHSPEEDEKLKFQLRHDEKELAENMMIVDLVRNDLARSSVPGSVVVTELFGIYSFRQVHQMISTVKSRLRPEISFTEAIRNAFPIGSMTGAPKRKVMELIEQYENSRRGLYSGATGFISPEGDFDFNVVIRSMLYNAGSKTLSFQVGGAITYDSVPEKEYAECLLKAHAILKALGINGITI